MSGNLLSSCVGACFGWRYPNHLSAPGSPGLSHELCNVELVCEAKNLVVPNLLKNHVNKLWSGEKLGVEGRMNLRKFSYSSNVTNEEV